MVPCARLSEREPDVNMAHFICHIAFIPISIVWLQFVWLLVMVSQQYEGLTTAYSNGQIFYGKKEVYANAVYHEFVSSMLRLVEDPLQLIVNVLLMSVAPEEVNSVNVISLVITVIMMTSTLVHLPRVLSDLREASDGG